MSLKFTYIRWGRLWVIIAILTVVVFLWWDNIVYGVAGGSYLLLHGFSLEKDRIEAKQVYETIISSHHFDHSSPFDRSQPPVYYEGGSHFLLTAPIDVTMYFVTSKADQDAIIEALRDLQRQQRTKPIRLRFYAEENWSSGGRRGPEELLREVTVTSPK